MGDGRAVPLIQSRGSGRAPRSVRLSVRPADLSQGNKLPGTGRNRKCEHCIKMG